MDIYRQTIVLFDYGNDVGTRVQAFENTHTNSVSILDSHAKNRADAGKKAAVKRLGDDFIALGTSLRAMSVPTDARTVHEAYVHAYQAVGENLKAISETDTDETFLNAVTAYNSSVDTLSQSFVAFATFFSARTILFSSLDAGSVFMFSSSQ